MGQTPTYALPYPELADAPDGPSQLRTLAEKTETALGIAGIRKCTSGTRPTATAGTTIFETDTNRRWHGVVVGGVPYWAPVPGSLVFQAIVTDVQPVKGNEEYPIAFNSILFDVWGVGLIGPDATRYRPKVPGQYTLTGGCGFGLTRTDGWRQHYWKKNDLIVSGSVAYENPPLGGFAARTTVVSLNGTTDYIEAIAFHNVAGVNINLHTSTGSRPSIVVIYDGP